MPSWPLKLFPMMMMMMMMMMTMMMMFFTLFVEEYTYGTSIEEYKNGTLYN